MGLLGIVPRISSPRSQKPDHSPHDRATRKEEQWYPEFARLRRLSDYLRVGNLTWWEILSRLCFLTGCLYFFAIFYLLFTAR